MFKSAVVALLLTLSTVAAVAETGQYQSRADFLLESLGSRDPQSGVVWLDDELRKLATGILGHPPGVLRMRYWYAGARTAWIIDEIGKEKPITLGVVVEDNEIQAFRVLQFRESRGWEIRYPFFTDQFSLRRLSKSGSLDGRIDGVTGATLSVRAATRSATLALVLDEYTKQRRQITATTR